MITFKPTPETYQKPPDESKGAVTGFGSEQEQQQENSNFKGLAYGVGDISIRSSRQIFNVMSRVRRLESDANKNFKRGGVVNHPPRPTNLSTTNVPYPTIVSVTATDYTHVDRAATQVTIVFNRPSDQRNWQYAQIAVKNYRANPNWVYVATANQSPVSFVLENTGETVVIAVASMDLEGRINDVSLAPTASVALNTTHQVNFSSITFSVQPLTQHGTTTQIDVASFVATISKNNASAFTVSYNSGTVDPGSFGTYYVYFDDAKLAGGTVTYLATTNNATVTSLAGIIYLGKITTAGGGGGTGSGGGGGPCFAQGTLIETPDGFVAIECLKIGDAVVSMNGFSYVTKLHVHDFDGELVIMPHQTLVTKDHRIWYRDKWRRAGSVYFPVRPYRGKVYNLSLNGEHNYRLENGTYAHNVLK